MINNFPKRPMIAPIKRPQLPNPVMPIPGRAPAAPAVTPSIKGGWQSLIKNPNIRKV